MGTVGYVAAKEDVMTKVVAINGSPGMQKGNTAMILTPFIEGMQEAGAEVELFYAKRLKVEPCTGGLICWRQKPGECYIKDDMRLVYPKLWEAEILVLATPVYIPLPGEMQNIINRLVPLLDPLLETREGRTRARFRKEVAIRKMVVVATGGWWEKANLDTVVQIVKELARVASVEFAGAILDQLSPERRPEVLRSVDELLGAVRRATEKCCPGAFDHLMREPDPTPGNCCDQTESTK